MSDNEQHFDETGGPPPTNPGPSGGVDGGNGRPDPQRQGDGTTIRNGQTNPQRNEENIVQPPEAVDDNQQHGQSNPDQPQGPPVEGPQPQGNQHNTDRPPGLPRENPQRQGEQQRGRDQLVNQVRDTLAPNGTNRTFDNQPNLENAAGNGRDFSTSPGMNGHDHDSTNHNYGRAPRGIGRPGNLYPLDDQFVFDERPELSRNDTEFNKHAPKWHIGKSVWDVFQADFMHVIKRFGVKERFSKSVLYSHILGEAKSLIVPHMDPDLPRFRAMRFQQYARELKAVFEPVHDAPMLRVAFATRTQGRYEHVLKYVQHKLTAFLAAYTQSQPPWFIYYEETTNGLLNKPLASELRRYQPQPANNYMGYRNHLSGLLQARQADYLSGILKDNDMIGIELDVLMNPVDYKAHKPDSATINSLTEGDTLNAMENRACYHCGQVGHLKPDCPRRMSGMAPAKGIGNDHETSTTGTSVNQVDKTIETVGNQRRRFIPYRIVRRPAGQNRSPSKYLKRKTISVLETEDGEYHVDPIQLEGTEDSDQVEALSSQLNTMSLEGPSSDEESLHDNGFQNVDYCVESFLDV